jgi:hypothetical protein
MKTLIISPTIARSKRKLEGVHAEQFAKKNVVEYKNSYVDGSLKTNEGEYRVVSFSDLRGRRADEVLIDADMKIGDVFNYVLPIVQYDRNKIKLFN